MRDFEESLRNLSDGSLSELVATSITDLTPEQAAIAADLRSRFWARMGRQSSEARTNQEKPLRLFSRLY